MEAVGCVHVFQLTYSPTLDKDEVGKDLWQGWNKEIKNDVLSYN